MYGMLQILFFIKVSSIGSVFGVYGIMEEVQRSLCAFERNMALGGPPNFVLPFITEHNGPFLSQLYWLVRDSVTNKRKWVIALTSNHKMFKNQTSMSIPFLNN